MQNRSRRYYKRIQRDKKHADTSFMENIRPHFLQYCCKAMEFSQFGGYVRLFHIVSQKSIGYIIFHQIV